MEFLKVKQDNSKLREHQVLAKTKIFEAWEEYNSVMLQMPTGTGKTYLFASIINDIVRTYKNCRREINILVVAHRTELLEQISATLDKFGVPHGYIQGSREQHLWRRVQIGSIMSLLTDKNYLHTLRQKYDYIIVDEAHHSLADTYVKLFKLFPEARKLGVTATPWRLNHESFLPLYQTLVQSPQISWFIQHGILADFEYVSIKPDSEIQKLVNQSEIAPTGDFVNADLDNTFNNQRIRSKLFESYFKYAKGRKGIIYAINKFHAAKIANMYSSHGIRAVAIDCDTPKDERQHLISLFKNGEIQVLVNVEIFTEGFDCPDVSFIQLARPTRSLTLYLQQVGRGLRITEGKDKTIILDNVGLYNYFGLPDANRMWRRHFKGSDDIERNIDNARRKENETGNECVSDYSIDESKFNEDNEPMLIVRGASTSINTGTIENGLAENYPDETNNEQPQIPAHKLWPIEEFCVADYYLVRGNRLKFNIYPFIQKKGKRTEAIGASVLENTEPLVFGSNIDDNRSMVEMKVKLHSILLFAAMRLNLMEDEIYNINRLAEKTNARFSGAATLFDVLKMMSKVQP